MRVEKVKIVFNDDGRDTVQVGDEKIEFGSMADNVEEVAASLRMEGFTPSVTPLREGGLDDFIRDLGQDGAEMVFNLCEGAFENSLFEMNVAALLELFGLKFTGSGPLALGLALNKGLAKDILSRRGIPTADYCVVDSLPVRLSNDLRFPIIVKPLREDASVGIEADAVVKNIDELEKRVDYVLKNYYQPALLEEYIEGREFNISVLGNGSEKRTLPPSEIDFSGYPEGTPKICCYEAKWITMSPLYIKSPPICPADIPASLAGELRDVALQAYDAIGCRDYARVDLRVGTDGGLRVLEVNPNPDISSDAGFVRAAKSAGLEYHQLIGEIVRVAAARYEKEAVHLETERVDSHEEGSKQG
jgi:D-alanine-D-alanine ligase